MACNTSTAVALGEYRRRYDIPVLGVIRPGAQAAALATRTRRVGVIATPATIRSHAYFDAIKEENPAVEVYEHATPSLVPLVEAGVLAGSEAVRGSRRGAGAVARTSRRRRANSSTRCPHRRRSTRCCSGARTTRSSGRSSRPRQGRGSRSSTARRRRPGRSRSCSPSTAWKRRARRAGRRPTRVAPGTTHRPSAPHPDPPPAHDRRPRRVPGPGQPPVRRRLPAGRVDRARRGRCLSSRAMAARRPSTRSSAAKPAGGVWQAGFLVGRSGGRRRHGAGPAGRRRGAHGTRGLAGGWAVRRGPSAARARPADGPEIAATEPAYRAAMARVVPALEAALGAPLPGIVDRVAVVDRAGWVEANLVTFSSLFGKLERELLDQLVPQGAGLSRPPWRSRTAGSRRASSGSSWVHGPAGSRPVRPGPPVGGNRAGTAALRGGEHPRHGRSLGVDAGPLPDLDRAPRDDPCVRVRGAPVAAALPGGAPGAPADRVLAEHVAARRRRRPGGRAGPARR